MTNMKQMTLSLFTSLGLAALLPGQTPHPEIPVTPAPVRGIVSIQPFELESPTPHYWRVEKPPVRTGYLLVLRVDPALVYPRQVAEPVLYVGNQTAERVNVGYESGHVVAILPAVIDPEHADYVDLSEELFWFGLPELPERIGSKRIAEERRLAVAAGIRPFSTKQIAAAGKRGGTLNQQATKRDLIHDVMKRLVSTYSPQEQSLIEGVLAAESGTAR